MARRSIIVFLFVLSVVTVRAEAILGFGYQFGFFQFGNINRTVNTYNYSRPWLDQKMNYFGFMQGYQLQLGWEGKHWGFEGDANLLSRSHVAYGTEPASGLVGYRKIHLKLASWDFGITRIWAKDESMSIGYTVAFTMMKFSAFAIYANDASFANSQEELCISEATLANTLRLNISVFPLERVGISLRPYVMIPWHHVYTEGLMTYLQGDTNPQRSSLWNYGCTFNLTFRLGRNTYY
jgi:hypothetical protein